MLNTNIDWYKNISRKDALDWYDWGVDVMEGSPIFVSDTVDNETAESALAAAIVDCVGIDVLREEDNCEDASNVIAREAYVFAYGDASMAEMLADRENVNWLMGAACEFVKEHGKHYGIEWEEYRW